MGMEWLHRFAHEPRRLFRRYFVDDAPYAVRLLLRAVRRRVLSSSRSAHGMTVQAQVAEPGR